MPGEIVKHHGNPVLSDAQGREPWEKRYDNMQPNVYLDEGKYKLWYSSSTICEPATTGPADTCSVIGSWPCSGIPGATFKERDAALMYAESSDGMKWHKPALGLVKFKDNTSNNIVIGDTSGAGVLIDSQADPSQRFKLFGELPDGTALAVSSDGLTWPRSKWSGRSRKLDPHGTHNNLVYDAQKQVYVGFGRVSNVPFRTESVAESKTSDFLGNWTSAIPAGLEKDENNLYQPDALVVLTEPYEGVHLGFVNMLNLSRDD